MDSRSARDLVLRQKPDAIVLDLMLGDEDGLTLIRELRQLTPGMRIVVLTMLEPAEYRHRALAAGADDFVHKAAGIEAVVDALLGRSAAAADRTAPAALATSGDTDEMACLSDRELQVFHLVGLGRTTKEISAVLFISPKTVDAHKEHIKVRLGLVNAAQLTARAARWVAQHRV